MIAEIANTIGVIAQGITTSQQSKQTESCGKQPGVFASKAQKSAFRECMTKSQEAKIIDAQTRNRETSLRAAQVETDNTKKVIYIGIAVVVFAAISLTIVLVIRKKKNK